MKTIRNITSIFCIVAALCCFNTLLQAQSTYYPLGHRAYIITERLQLQSGEMDTVLHTAMKPYLRQAMVQYAEARQFSEDLSFAAADRRDHSYLYKDSNEWSESGAVDSKKPILRRFYQNQADFFSISKGGSFLKINPLLHLQLGYERLRSGKVPFINTRGAEMRACIDGKIGIAAFFTENQARYPLYVNDRVFSQIAVPYEGRFLPFKNDGVDFFGAGGYITFPLTRHIQVQMGQDKNFIGEGERSLLLSDFSNNYPFIKINTQIGAFQYTNIYAQLIQQFSGYGDGLKEKKFLAAHYLSVNLHKKFNIGLYEGVVVQRDNGRLDAAYWNPVIFYRTVETHLGSPDNVVLGLNMKYLPWHKVALYGQVVIDEWNFEAIKANDGDWKLKNGAQLGLKWIDVAGVSHLDMQIEWNAVRPYTYTHQRVATNYSHYNAPLAHPLGTNFKEWLGIVRYMPHHRLQLQFTMMHAVYGKNRGIIDDGGDIFTESNLLESKGNYIGQGVRFEIDMGELVMTYMPKHNFFIDLTLWHRSQHTAKQTLSSNFVSLALRWNMAGRGYRF